MDLPDESFRPTDSLFVAEKMFNFTRALDQRIQGSNLKTIRCWIISGDLMIQKVVEQRKEVDVTRTAAMGH